uniref:ATP synthase complex subunit 8 n=1 Tax=Triatoma rubrofasciata TaxID=162384 RepID=A0A3G6VB69_9HEMI|nr:ATP synthase F0 subunit 8 [Triatoma rubrofasciata]
MPQMAPIWWTTMYFTFISSFLIMFMMLYFYTNLEPMNKMKNSVSFKKTNWKW